MNYSKEQRTYVEAAKAYNEATEISCANSTPETEDAFHFAGKAFFDAEKALLTWALSRATPDMQETIRKALRPGNSQTYCDEVCAYCLTLN